MHITIDKKLQKKIQKAAALTGVNTQELTNRAIILYLESIRGMNELTEEITAWQELGGTSFSMFEQSIIKHA